MTIQTTNNTTTAVGDGVSVDFATVFPFTANNEVFVTRVTIASGNRTPMTEGVDYTMTGAGNPAGGTVHTIGPFSPTAATYQIEMLRVLPLTQLINLVANDQFGAETVERGLDRGVMIDQQLDARLQVVEAGGTGSGAALDGANVGTGTGVFAGKVANALTFWRLRAGIGTTITQDANGIRFDSEHVDAANIGSLGLGVYAGNSGNTQNFWKLRAGSGMTLTLDADGIRFDTVTGVSASVTNVGTGTGLVFRDQVGTIFNFKTLKAGTNISLANNADDITISAAGSGGGTIGANVGAGAGLVYRDLVGSVLNFKTIKAGTNIAITNNADDITIDSTTVAGGLPSPGALPTSKFLRGDLTWTNVLAGQSFQIASAGSPVWLDIVRESAPLNEKVWRLSATDGTNQSLSFMAGDDARSNFQGGMTFYRNNASTPPAYSLRNVSIHSPLQVGSGFAFGASEPATAMWVKGLTKIDGNIVVPGGVAGRTFQADFSDANIDARFSFQTSVLNADTNAQFKPNGTGTGAGFIALNNSNASGPAAFIGVRIDATSAQLRNSTVNGGANLPFVIYSTGNVGFSIDPYNNAQIGGLTSLSMVGTELPTNATTNFPYIPSMNGTPSGTPTVAKTGFVPIVFDRLNNKLCIYNAGVWKQATLT